MVARPGVPIYLDTAATAPLDERVRVEVLRHLGPEYANAGSRSHEFGRRARSAVERARYAVARVVEAGRADVIFTSGATESNNLALLGLAAAFSTPGHIVSTAIEHRAVLEPLRALAARGWEVTLVRPGASGAVDADVVRAALRSDTRCVSIMHVNNETGVIQPVAAIADALQHHEAVLHVDAAQGYGKELTALRHPRIDSISVSGHKIGAPQGIGALVLRRRNGARPPLEPLSYGGGQERGLRPGTLPVALIAGLGLAAELALDEHDDRSARCAALRDQLLPGLARAGAVINGDPAASVPHIVNLSFPGLDAEAVIGAWEEFVAISNGAACTTTEHTCSHVLSAMGLPAARIEGAVRLSWQHDTPRPPVEEMLAALERMRSGVAT